MDTFLSNLRARVANKPLRKIIFPETNDERILEAAKIIIKEKIATPIFVCDVNDISKVKNLGFECVETEKGKDPLIYGMQLLNMGKGDGLVAGASYTTADVLRAGLSIVGKAEGIQTVSSSFYMIVPAFRGTKEEVLTFSDCAVVPQPTAEQLADITISASDARASIVGDEPRVALLSYSTKGSGGDNQSITIVREALKLIRARRPKLIVDGEIQADAALIKSISERKAPGNLIEGKANVLIFPSLDSANIAYKLVTCLVPGVQALGPILQGLKKPISDLSRGVKVDDIVNIVSIVASQVHD